MSEFFEKPILNSPYGYPSRHWELDREGQPTHRIIQQRRPAEFLTPIPQAKKRKAVQQTLTLYDDRGISTDDQQYSLSLFINKSLKTTLKAEIDEEAWSSLHSDTSRPFGKPKSGRIAVKVINHLGDEVMKVFSV
jgi:hypothetical protein